MKLIAIELINKSLWWPHKAAFKTLRDQSFWSISCGATKFELLKPVLHQFIYLSVML